jgi:DNA-binding NarL/FixJ family response regulator
MRILIADDHDLFRAGLRNLLEEQGLSVIGEASTGAETVELARDLLPDVVVMDLNMPTMSGVEATRRILEVSPSTNVVILALSDEDSEVKDAILAGACGYLLKDASIHELVSGVRAAARGETA